MNRLLVGMGWILAAVLAAPVLGDDPPGAIDYLRDIKPLLARRCYSCHGALEQKQGLRLDTAELIRKGGENGPIVEPGQAGASFLIDVVTGEAGFRMPPEGEPLAAAEIDRLRAWIDAGAVGPSDEQPQQDPARHWAFVPPVRPETPRPRDPAWGRNPIDTLLAAEHDRRGLTHQPHADRPTLLRRVSLDLTGLVPTRAELRAFLDDPAEDAYEKAVDRLLASPRYGERWGRHWMDVWRYSDWAGYGAEVRESQPHIWRWRDWIIDSLNEDKPYNQMLQEMLAGDELAPDDPDVLRATGFLVRNWYKFNRHVWLDATVEHTSKAFLGLTINCARCHDHKYDPIAQADYYRFKAFFQTHEIGTDRVPGQPDTNKAGVVRVFDGRLAEPTYLFRRGDDKQPDEKHPLQPGLPAILGGDLSITPVPLPTAAFYPALRAHIREEFLQAAERKLAEARKALETARKAEDDAQERAVVMTTRLDATAAERDRAGAGAERARAGVLAAARELAAAQAGLEAVQAKLAADQARFRDPPDSKQADLLAIQAAHAERQAARLAAEAAVARAEHERAVAQAALDPAAAKTKQAVEAAEAKLAAAQKTLDEARKTASAKHTTAYTPLLPPRPATSTGRRLALARWIADRNNPLTARVAVNHVWMRHFGRPLVPTVFDFGRNGTPPTHPDLLDWLAVEFMDSGWSLKHLHRLIVTSNAYRMRSWTEPDDPNRAIDPENVYLWRAHPRRMEAELVRDNVLYVAGSLALAMGGPDLDQNDGLKVFRRSLYFRHANEKVMTFLKIFDAANVNSCYRRDESVMPQQALALANSPLALGQARVLAGKLSAQVANDAEFITAAFECVLSRAPTPDEQALCREYLAQQAARLAEPARLTPFADGPAPAVPPSSNPGQRARENLVHVLINHNDFVTIR